MVEFRELTMADEKRYCDYMKEWLDHDEDVVPCVTDIVNYHNYEELVHVLADNKSHHSDIDNTTYFLFKEGVIIGAANIRHDLNAELRQQGGHIEFGVRQRYRNQGYGNKIFKKALDYLSRLDIKEALITCDRKNMAAIEVIEKNGGEELESSALSSDEENALKRFSIEIG